MGIEVLLGVAGCVPIAEVSDVLASAMPADSRLFKLSHRVNKRLHALVVQAVRFGKVADIYAHESVLSDVHD